MKFDKQQIRARIRPAYKWYNIDQKAVDENVIRVYIYDEIGYFGVTADEFVRDLNAIKVDNIELHLNTPGGNAFDGIAIYNALRNHAATVTSYVDGLAASAGSFIMLAGDRVLVEKTAQVMVHDAAGLSIGNASDMHEMADLLDKMSNNIAGIYADRAGGSIEDWRDVMRAETWFSSDEAVKAGLADAVNGADEGGPGDDVDDKMKLYDLSVFTYGGRESAPSPSGVVGLTKKPEEPDTTTWPDLRAAFQEAFK